MYKLINSNPKQVILETVREYKSVLAPTYGPAGMGVLIDNGSKTELVDDGQKASNAMSVKNEFHNTVLTYLKEGAEKTNSRVGDGTTTSGIIMAEIVETVLDEKSEDMFAKVKNSHRKEANELKIAVVEAVAAIKKAAKKVKTKEELKAIAYNSFNNEEISTTIADLVQKTGPNGVILVEESQGVNTESSITQGLEIDRGYASPFLANGETKIKNPQILLTTKPLERAQELVKLLQSAVDAQQKDFVVLAESFSDEVIAATVISNARSGLRIMLVQAPSYGDHKRALLEDIAALTGAKVIDPKTGDTAVLGTCDKVIITKSTTTFINGESKGLSEYVANLTKSLEGTSHLEKERLEHRIAALTTGIGIIKVGADTEAEMITLKAKVDDAVHATQAAARSGIVEGAGKTYAKITTSSEVLNKALQAPRKQLIENGEEMLDDKVYDPAEVLIAALESGVSIACGLITMGSIIARKREEKNNDFSLD